MKTAELVEALAAEARPAPPARPAALVTAALALGGVLAATILVCWLGTRPLGIAVRTSPFWMKTAYTSALAVGGVLAVLGLARPGGRVGPAPQVWVAAFGVLAILAALQTMRAPVPDMARIWLGQSWQVCSWRIIALAGPIFVCLVWALRRLAPTRLALAGAAAGCLAGGLGATVYGLYCAETAPAFVLVWYTLGVGACAGLGAMAGRWLLRW